MDNTCLYKHPVAHVNIRCGLASSRDGGKRGKKTKQKMITLFSPCIIFISNRSCIRNVQVRFIKDQPKSMQEWSTTSHSIGSGCNWCLVFKRYSTTGAKDQVEWPPYTSTQSRQALMCAQHALMCVSAY